MLPPPSAQQRLNDLSTVYPPEELPMRFAEVCTNTFVGLKGRNALEDFLFQIKRGREYIHQRNPKINLILTAVAIIFLALGLGLGIGHFLGWSERLELQEMYAEVREDRMDELTDSLVSCMTGEEAAGGDDQDLDDRVIQQGGNSMRKFWA